jgi:hypothetical protein
MNLRTETELANLLAINPAKVADLRRRHNWPHIRLGRFDVRYTDAQVEQVLAIESVTPKRSDAEAALASGQSKRSAAKKAS